MAIRQLNTLDPKKTEPKAIDNFRLLHAIAGALDARTGRLEPAVAQLEARPMALTIDQIKQFLQYSGGPDALNVTSLAGVLAQPQPAGIPLLSDFPPVTAADNGLLANVNGVLYYFDAQDFEPGQWVPIAANGTIIIGTHATRIASYNPAVQPVGELFFESDRAALYGITNPGGGNVWSLLLSRPEAGVLAGIPGDLGTDDEGFMYYATDVNHVYRWSGSAWAYGPGDLGRDYVQFFRVAPEVTGWALCNGVNATFSKPDGTSEVKATPSMVGTPTFARGNAAAGGTGQVTTGAGASNYLDFIPYVRL